MNITMINRPRQSGKTQALKLYFHENHFNYDYILVQGFCKTHTEQLKRYFEKYRGDLITCVRGLRNKKVLVLLDEPFLWDVGKQNQFLCDLEYSGCGCDVYGVGTLPELEGFARYF